MRRTPHKSHHNKFGQKDNFRDHERIHTGEKPFSCPGCDNKFVEKDKFRDYERINNNNICLVDWTALIKWLRHSETIFTVQLCIKGGKMTSHFSVILWSFG